jgi:two-component system LytT family response regulator
MPPDRIRILVVDDEPLARDCVRLALRDEPSAEVVGECGDGRSAVQAIRELQPDVVFLDVQMPEMDGFAVVEDVGAGAMPPVVFVTAFDRYAVRAFESHALDYVLKPFENARLVQALHRARTRIADRRDGELGRRLAALLGERVDRESPVRRFAVRENERVHFVPAAEVDWIEADGNYVVLHAGAKKHRIRLTLGSLAKRLDAARFVQVHRSAIVNLDKVREVQAWFGGDYIAVLQTGEQLRVSRTHAPLLLRPAR